MSIWNPEEEQSEEVLTQEANEHCIVLFNDDVNTFDHVIISLIQICEHTEEQAAQCALIVHHKGKCDVKPDERLSRRQVETGSGDHQAA